METIGNDDTFDLIWFFLLRSTPVLAPSDVESVHLLSHLHHIFYQAYVRASRNSIRQAVTTIGPFHICFRFQRIFSQEAYGSGASFSHIQTMYLDFADEDEVAVHSLPIGMYETIADRTWLNIRKEDLNTRDTRSKMACSFVLMMQW